MFATHEDGTLISDFGETLGVGNGELDERDPVVPSVAPQAPLLDKLRTLDGSRPNCIL